MYCNTCIPYINLINKIIQIGEIYFSKSIWYYDLKKLQWNINYCVFKCIFLCILLKIGIDNTRKSCLSFNCSHMLNEHITEDNIKI